MVLEVYARVHMLYVRTPHRYPIPSITLHDHLSIFPFQALDSNETTSNEMKSPRKIRLDSSSYIRNCLRAQLELRVSSPPIP